MIKGKRPAKSAADSSSMQARSKQLAMFALILALASAGLAGCSTVKPWAQGGSDHPAQAGGSVRVPFATSPRIDTYSAGGCMEPRPL